MRELSGGYCGGGPPLPIPNREVKPACADGTAMQCGRVGGRHFYFKALRMQYLQGFFVCYQFNSFSMSLNSSVSRNRDRASPVFVFGS